MKITTAIIAVMCAAILFWLASQERSIDKDYRWASIYGLTHVIVRGKGEIVLQPNVRSLTTLGRFIVGDRQPPMFGREIYDDRYGYFIVDRSTNYVELGLSEQELKDRLYSFGFDRDAVDVSVRRLM